MLAAALLLFAPSHLLLKSPHFELITDAGEKPGREALVRLERVRRVFTESIGGRETPLPVRVFLFAGEREYHQFSPNAVARAFYQSGPERDFIVMSAATGETWRIINHEYVHLVLNHSAASLPQWLEEGTAEFYSTLDLKGDRLLLGLPIESHIRTLLTQKWLDPQTLSAVTRGSRFLDESQRAGLFYAQSWALVHMLNSAAIYRKNMPRFADLLERATPVGLAFEQAFGKSFDQAQADLNAYVHNKRFAVSEVYGPPDQAAIDIEVQPLPQPAAELMKAGLLIQLGRFDVAEARLKNLGAAPEALTERALLALNRKNIPEAIRLLQEAIAGQKAPAIAYFEYAMLLRDTQGDKAEIRRYLEEAAGRNPRLAEAHFLLGLAAQQEGRHREAIVSFEQAAAVLPRQSYFWHAIALSYHALGDHDRARRAARKAADSAATLAQRDMAISALRLVSANAPTPAAPLKKPEVSVPETWKPKQGDARIEGTLEQIDCLGPAARFHIRSGGKSIAFWIDKPGEVLLRSESSITFTFACGPQQPRPVVLDYNAQPDAARKVQGTVMAIEFK